MGGGEDFASHLLFLRGKENNIRNTVEKSENT